MKLLANENFPLSSVNILKESGFDIKAIGVECSGVFDEEVIDFANKEERTVLTFDSDYGELIFKKGLKPKNGVIYLRWHKFKPKEPGEYLIKLFKKEDIEYTGLLTVISDKSIRQRKYI